jgi:hypothetical protein
LKIESFTSLLLCTPIKPEKVVGKFVDIWSVSFNRCCGLQAIKYCANSPLARIGAQVPAWLAPMTDKQSLLQEQAELINLYLHNGTKKKII